MENEQTNVLISVLRSWLDTMFSNRSQQGLSRPNARIIVRSDEVL